MTVIVVIIIIKKNYVYANTLYFTRRNGNCSSLELCVISACDRIRSTITILHSFLLSTTCIITTSSIFY